MICDLMVFYKGSLSYKELCIMPLTELFMLHDNAAKINRATEEKANK